MTTRALARITVADWRNRVLCLDALTEDSQCDHSVGVCYCELRRALALD